MKPIVPGSIGSLMLGGALIPGSVLASSETKERKAGSFTMRRLKLMMMTAAAALLGGVGLGGEAKASDFFNGFEIDTSGWDVFGGSFNANRVSSGTNGVPSSSGSWHAEDPGAPDPAVGNAGNWGGYNDVDGCAATACAAGATFPTNGYHTSIDFYLDVDGGFSNDTRFEFSSAVSQPDGNFQRDFVFNCGFYDDNTGPGAGGDRFICSASNNAFRANAFPKNPDKDPVVVTTETGWFTFQHFFHDDGTGVLAVEMSIFDSDGNLIKSWVRSDPTDTINGTIGGNRYGWIVTNELDFLAYDNTLRRNGPPVVAVPVDIKPRGCRNPLASKARGVLPAAILGTSDFDVSEIDPSTVSLEGVAPLRFNFEDVATPFEPFVGKEDPFDCTSAGPDGQTDMTLKFDNQAIIAALEPISRGDVLVLELSGELMGGTPIVGEDVVVVVN